MPKRTDIHKILIIGSGPIVIGQACEFDYSGTQACRSLKDEGFEVVLVNSNPATIMTDPEIADRTYIEPLTLEAVTAIIEKERPDALLPTVGGQTGLNLSVELYEKGILEKIRRQADRREHRRDQGRRRPRAFQEGDGRDGDPVAEGRFCAHLGRGASDRRGNRLSGDRASGVYARRNRRRHRI